MAQDIFNREVDLGEPISADAVRLIFTSALEGDLLMQQAAFQHNQNITRLWEISSAKTYFFAGRTQGQITAKRVIGQNNASLDFINQFGNVCNIAGNSLGLTLKSGCGQGASDRGSMTAVGVVVQSVTYAIVAQEMLINEDLSMLFAYMQP